MTKLEFVEKGYAKLGVELGFITATVYQHYERFKIYKEARAQDNGHIQSIDIAAKLTRASRSSVRRSVNFFK